MIKLTTDRLILRPFKNTDIDELFEIIQEEEIRKFLPGIYTDSKEELMKTLEVYANADFVNDIYLSITEKETGKVIGALVLVRVHSTSMEISYFIRKDKREMGLMFEAIRAFVDWYAKSGLKNTIVFIVSKANQSSLYLCAKMSEYKIPILNIAECNDKLYYTIRPVCLKN